MRKLKASTRMKTKKTKMLMSFKNTFCNKNRQTKVKTQSDMKAWNAIYFTNQASLTLSRFIKTPKEKLANIQPS